MTNQFVPYEVAIKMRELGFDEETIKVYDTMGFLQEEQEIDELGLEKIPAPLYQQVFKWFREKHMKSPRFYIDTNGWYFTITQFTESGSSLTDSKLAPLAKQDYKTYEEAELACINKMLELI